MKRKWYFNSWLIGILFALWPIYGVPLGIGILLLIFKGFYEKKQIAEIESKLAESEKKCAALEKECADAEQKIKGATRTGAEFMNEKWALQKQLDQANETIESLKKQNRALAASQASEAIVGSIKICGAGKKEIKAAAPAPSDPSEAPLSLPSEYVVFDIETTGVSIQKSEILEIGAVKVKGGNVVDTFETFVRPEGPLSPAAMKVNHITYDMVKDARSAAECVLAFKYFVGNSVLIGYNSDRFDLPIIRRVADPLNIDFSNQSIDLLPIARKTLSLSKYSLSSVADYYGVDASNAHRAVADCIITLECCKKLASGAVGQPSKAAATAAPKKRRSTKSAKKTEALRELQGVVRCIMDDGVLEPDEVDELKDWMDVNLEFAGEYPFNKINCVVLKALDDGVLEPSEIEEISSALKDFLTVNIAEDEIVSIPEKNICLTGEFKNGGRKEIESEIVKAGGVIKNSVSSRTDYVVMGDLGSPDWSFGSYGGKVQKAMEVQANGGKVKIVREQQLMDALAS